MGLGLVVDNRWVGFEWNVMEKSPAFVVEVSLKYLASIFYTVLSCTERHGVQT